MSPRATHGVVTLPALDLRRRPAHAAELESQLLMGEVVRVRGATRDGGWLRVENQADADRGWVRAWGIVRAPAARAVRWLRRARTRVQVSYVEVRGVIDAEALVTPLTWGARVIAGPPRRGLRPVELPDGRRGVAPEHAFAPEQSARRRSSAGGRSAPPRGGPGERMTMMDRIRSLLGVPYLWGGRTPMGMDCSGFTQLVLAEQGIALPRNAKQQYRAGRALRRGEMPDHGDLVFFGNPGEVVGHVGIALGDGYYAHCRGYVRINSFDHGNPLYDSALARQLRGARRVG